MMRGLRFSDESLCTDEDVKRTEDTGHRCRATPYSVAPRPAVPLAFSKSGSTCRILITSLADHGVTRQFGLDAHEARPWYGAQSIAL
jgi:hypothetical protein